MKKNPILMMPKNLQTPTQQKKKTLYEKGTNKK